MVSDKIKIIRVGNIYPSGGQNGEIYHEDGISPTLSSGQGKKGNGIGSNNAPKCMVRNKNTANEIKVVGNYMPSNHDASRIVSDEGIDPTVKENHGTVTGVKQQINYKGEMNMWKNELTKYDFLMEELRVADFFAGIGALHQSLKDLGVPVKVTSLSEIDIDATISYAASHIKNFKDLEFEYPSDEEMKKWLMDRNIGYSYEKDKSSVPRMKKDKLKLAYKANVLLNNFGDVAKINYEEMPDFDLMNFSFSCFLPGTLVLTDSGYKNIEDITSEDKVLTHTNQYKKVVKPMVNYVDEKIYNIKTMCATDTFVTKEHPFYVRERHRVYDKEMKKTVRKFKDAEWVKAEDLTKNHYVGIAINNECEFPNWGGIEVNSTWNKYGHTRRINRLSRYFNNEFFWWIVGRYIGDGWVSNRVDNKGTDIYNLYICCAKDELNEITDVLDLLNRIGDNDFPYKVYEKRTVYNIRISNVEFAKYLQRFGKGAKNKELTSDIFNLPKKELKGFLDGYMSSDGCFTQGNFKASSISNKLIYGIAQCEAKVYGRPYSIYLNKRKKQTIIEGRLVNQNDGYEVKWKPENKKQDKAFYEDGYIWCPINKIETVDYQGRVYNMEVEDDNSYTANGIIVHNCTDLSNSGKQRGMRNADGTPTRSGLYVYGMKAIRTKKPKYVMIENVKGLIQKKFIDDFYSIIDELEEIGYNCYYPTKEDKKGNVSPVCLNAKHFGIPQNRERIFVIAIRKDVDNGGFKFHQGKDYGVRLRDVLEDNVEEKYYLSQEIQDRFKLNGKSDENRNELNVVGSSAPESRTIGQRDITYGINGVMSRLTATDYKQPKQIIDVKKLDSSGYTVCEKRYDEGLRFFKDNICGAVRTVDAGGDKRIIENGAIRGRYNEDGVIEQRLELRNDGVTNTLTTVEKDNIIVEHRLNKDYFIDTKGRCQEFEEKENYIQWDVSGKGYASQQDRAFYEDGHLGTIPANNAGNKMNVIENMPNEFRIRKLTPLECWRLMGFKDENFYKAKELGLSDSALYKQAGNSIVVNVLHAIFKNLFEEHII